MNLPSRAEIQCLLFVLQRVRIIEVFVKENIREFCRDIGNCVRTERFDCITNELGLQHHWLLLLSVHLLAYCIPYVISEVLTGRRYRRTYLLTTIRFLFTYVCLLIAGNLNKDIPERATGRFANVPFANHLRRFAKKRNESCAYIFAHDTKKGMYKKVRYACIYLVLSATDKVKAVGK